MKKSISTLLVTLLGGALLIYSATRSLDFISATLPQSRQILGWFALAALDGGLVFWLLHYLYGAKGGWQRGIALLMVIVDFVGCVAMFTMDTLFRTGETGMTIALTQEQIYTAVLMLSMVIALNVAAVVANHIFDPEARAEAARQEATDEIEELAIKQISENSKRLAAEIAPQIAANWLEDTKSSYYGGMSKRQALARRAVFSKNADTSLIPELVEVQQTNPKNDGRDK